MYSMYRSYGMYNMYNMFKMNRSYGKVCTDRAVCTSKYIPDIHKIFPNIVMTEAGLFEKGMLLNAYGKPVQP